MAYMKISLKQLALDPLSWCKLVPMTTSKKILLAASALASCGVLAAAPGLGIATARTGKATAAPVVKNIYLQGDSNDGWFWWETQKAPGDAGYNFATYRDITVKSGSTKFFFIWGHDSDNPGYHNIWSKKTGAAPWKTGICKTSACTVTTASTAVKFTNSRTQQNDTAADIKYPAAGWVPTAPSKKKALYSLYCNLHPNMVVRIYVQG
jgi:hypothetical protein